MPIYEYLCNACGERTSFFIRSISASFAPRCPRCGSEYLRRSISSFAFHKSLKTIHEESGDPDKAHKNPDYYKDPRNIGRWVEKRFSEMGIEMPQKIRDMIDAAREGELPKPVKDAL